MPTRNAQRLRGLPRSFEVGQRIRNIAQALGKSEDAVKANLYRMRRAISQSAPGLDSVLGAN